MQKKLFQTLLTPVLISASVGQAYAQQEGSCVANGTPTEIAQSCNGWATENCQSTNTGTCLTTTPECPWCFCVCSSFTSPDKEKMKDR